MTSQRLEHHRVRGANLDSWILKKLLGERSFARTGKTSEGLISSIFSRTHLYGFFFVFGAISIQPRYHSTYSRPSWACEAELSRWTTARKIGTFTGQRMAHLTHFVIFMHNCKIVWYFDSCALAKELNEIRTFHGQVKFKWFSKSVKSLISNRLTIN